MAQLRRGWLDTRGRIEATFQDDRLVRSLITKNGDRYIDKNELDVADTSRWAFILTYGAYIDRQVTMPTMQHMRAVSIGELIAPVLPDTYFLSTADANAKITKIIKYFMNHETPVNRGHTKAHYINDYNNIPENDRDENWARIPPNITDDEFLDQFGRDYCEYLLVSGPMDQSLHPIDLFTTLYVSVAKRGNVTTDFISKVANGLMDDLQHNANLDEETIQLVYRFYGGHIDSSNAQQILEAWLADIPELALRVRLTLQQATNSGLTCFVTVGRAIIKYPDFPWKKLDYLTGGELTNYQTAVNAVNGNPYYGFNKTLGVARSTLYSSIGYVAKELLIGLNGENSLKKYAGWIRAPKNAAVVRSMIDAYKTAYVARTEQYEPSAEDNAAFEQLRTTLMNNVNANMFA